MDHPRTAGDDRLSDRPYIRSELSAYPWIVGLLAIGLAASAGYYYYTQITPHQDRPAPAAVAEQAAPTPTPQAQPAIQNPLPAPEPAARSLPSLELSDSMMRELLAKLVGIKAFNDLVAYTQIIPRIVATVDNLPRQSAPRRM